MSPQLSQPGVAEVSGVWYLRLPPVYTPRSLRGRHALPQPPRTVGWGGSLVENRSPRRRLKSGAGRHWSDRPEAPSQVQSGVPATITRPDGPDLHDPSSSDVGPWASRPDNATLALFPGLVPRLGGQIDVRNFHQHSSAPEIQLHTRGQGRHYGVSRTTRAPLPQEAGSCARRRFRDPVRWFLDGRESGRVCPLPCGLQTTVTPNAQGRLRSGPPDVPRPSRVDLSGHTGGISHTHTHTQSVTHFYVHPHTLLHTHTYPHTHLLTG